MEKNDIYKQKRITEMFAKVPKKRSHSDGEDNIVNADDDKENSERLYLLLGILKVCIMTMILSW